MQNCLVLSFLAMRFEKHLAQLARRVDSGSVRPLGSPPLQFREFAVQLGTHDRQRFGVVLTPAIRCRQHTIIGSSISEIEVLEADLLDLVG